LESVAEVRVLGATAVAGPPCGVDGQANQIRQSAKALVRSGRLAALQGETCPGSRSRRP
jgi:hypothetical protein